MPKHVLLLHKPGDDEADPLGVPSQCTICNTGLVCTKENADKLGLFNPICFDCAVNGPAWVQEKLNELTIEGDE